MVGSEVIQFDGLSASRPCDSNLVEFVKSTGWPLYDQMKSIRKQRADSAIADRRVRRSSRTLVRGSHLDVLSLALIGNVSARKCRGKAVARVAETFSMRRLGGSRWRLRRTR
jgi:hypothetical protein